MKIILTAPPKTGKSTIVQKVIDGLPQKEYGIISKELRDQDGERVGFEAVRMDGVSKTFAHKFEIKSDYAVGGKYFVDLKVIDNFIVPEIEKGIDEPNSIVIVDEIGRMQSSSMKFLKSIKKLLNSNSNVLATVVYENEPWAREFKKHPEVFLVEVTLENREYLPEVLLQLFNNLNLTEMLDEKKRKYINSLTKDYFDQGKLVQLKKLYKNAIHYVTNGQIKEIQIDKLYEIRGNHSKHLVKIEKENYFCDCDLFSGKNEYLNNPGECSHIQSINIFRMKD